MYMCPEGYHTDTFTFTLVLHFKNQRGGGGILKLWGAFALYMNPSDFYTPGMLLYMSCNGVHMPGPHVAW